GRLTPVAGEAAAMRAEEERLANADSLHAAATTAHEALLGDPTAGTDAADAVTLLGHARRALDAVRRQGIDADPARLAAVQERRAVLARVTRLYGPGGLSAQVDGVPVTLPAPDEA